MFRVLHHDNCFDGACSAAVFTKFHQECAGGSAGYEYVGLSHAPNGGGVPESVFGVGENAIVDFKYSPSEKLTWWFDHHLSAFVTEGDRVQFEAGQRGENAERQFFDSDAISCTGFIARVAAEKFGFDVSGLSELLYWADIVDGARFESAASAVEMKEPALKLTLVIENAAPGLIPKIIPLLTEMPLAEVLAQPFVAAEVAPHWERHLESMRLVKDKMELADGAIYVDLSEEPVSVVSKFIPYYYSPDATYAVVVTRSSSKMKISVGTNPWTKFKPEELADIAAICQRFGGGGHARVGAISLPASELEKARMIARGVVKELRGQR